MKNTKEKGKFRIVVYKSGNQFVGVCLEIDERVFEKTAELAYKHIKEVARSYVELAQENKIDEAQLNQRPRLRYSFIWYLGPTLNQIRLLPIQFTATLSSPFTASSVYGF